MTQEKFIDIIKSKIKEKKMTYQQVADDVGCTYNSLYNFFTGKNSTSKIIFGLCNVLNIELKIYDKNEND